MSSHPPFADIQASRAPLEVDPFQITCTLNPNWVPGSGLTATHPASAHFAAAAKGDVPFRIVQPGVTEMDPRMIYKILIGAVSPRPIAMVGTCDEQGGYNLAPISFYQVVCSDPPLLMISFGGPGFSRRDSEANIRRTKEFCISSSSEPYAEALNYASIDCPEGTSEFAITGLTPVPGRLVRAPRIGEAPISFELTLHSVTDFHKDQGGRGGCMVIGRVRMIHIREDCITPDGAIDPSKTFPVSRFGGLLYGRSTRGFELERPAFGNVKDDENLQRAVAAGPPKATQKAAGGSCPVATKYP